MKSLSKTNQKRILTLIVVAIALLAVITVGVLFQLPVTNKANVSSVESEAGASNAVNVDVEFMGLGLNGTAYNVTRVSQTGAYLSTYSTTDGNPAMLLQYPSGHATRSVINYTTDGDHIAGAINSYKNAVTTKVTNEVDRSPRFYKVTFNPGVYDIMLVGAQGGNNYWKTLNANGKYSSTEITPDKYTNAYGYGGAGAVTSSRFTFTRRTSLYLFIGGGGGDYINCSSSTVSRVVFGGFNGGGDNISGDGAGAGGGATDLRFDVPGSPTYYENKTVYDKGNLYSIYNTDASLKTRIMVAGGGGGENDHKSGTPRNGGDAGSSSSLDGQRYSAESTTSGGAGVGTITGFTNSAGNGYALGAKGTFGKGGGLYQYFAAGTSMTSNNLSNNTTSSSAGGGGGWYGGGAGYNNQSPGGGGSSMIVGQRVARYAPVSTNLINYGRVYSSSSSTGTTDCTSGATAFSAAACKEYMVAVEKKLSDNGITMTDSRFMGGYNTNKNIDAINQSGKSTHSNLLLNGVGCNSSNGFATITCVSAKANGTGSNTSGATDGIKRVQAELVYESLTSAEYNYFKTRGTDTLAKTYRGNTLSLDYPGLKRHTYISASIETNVKQTAPINAHWRVKFQPGRYRFSIAGAQGGSVYGTAGAGGYGGKVMADLTITKPTTLYFYVGSAGESQYAQGGPAGTVYYGGYNGGGNCTPASATMGFATGGGATDIRLIEGEWDNANSLESRILVAGGGGGANDNANTHTKRHAGALTPGNEIVKWTPLSQYISYNGGTGSQTAGGQSNITLAGAAGSFGKGGGFNSVIATTDLTNSEHTYHNEGSGGGGGWYGGGAGNGACGVGGGGSSYAYTNDSTVYYADASKVYTGLPASTSLASKRSIVANCETQDGVSYAFTNVKFWSGGRAETNGTPSTEDITQTADGYAIIESLDTSYDADTNGTAASGIKYELCGDPLYYYESEASYSYASGTNLSLNYPARSLDLNLANESRMQMRFWKLTFQPGKYRITLAGAQGALFYTGNRGGYGGGGAIVTADLNLTEKTVMYLHIGSGGTAYNNGLNNYNFGGYNGGGDSYGGSGGGGGATDLRLYSEESVKSITYNYANTYSRYNTNTASLNSRILVAGGGGGANDNNYADRIGNYVGSGSGTYSKSDTGTITTTGTFSLNGASHSSTSYSGRGGTLTAGGTGGTSTGSFGMGGSSSRDAGGGGGGYYGGGNGAQFGGGGSSFVSGFSYGSVSCKTVKYNGLEYKLDLRNFQGAYMGNATTSSITTSSTNAHLGNTVRGTRYDYNAGEKVTTDLTRLATSANGYANIEVLGSGMNSKNDSQDYQSDSTTTAFGSTYTKIKTEADGITRGVQSGLIIRPADIASESRRFFKGSYSYTSNQFRFASNLDQGRTAAAAKLYIRTKGKTSAGAINSDQTLNTEGGYSYALADLFVDYRFTFASGSTADSLEITNIKRMPMKYNFPDTGLITNKEFNLDFNNDGELILYAMVYEYGTFPTAPPTVSYVPFSIYVNNDDGVVLNNASGTSTINDTLNAQKGTSSLSNTTATESEILTSNISVAKDGSKHDVTQGGYTRPFQNYTLTFNDAIALGQKNKYVIDINKYFKDLDSPYDTVYGYFSQTPNSKIKIDDTLSEYITTDNTAYFYKNYNGTWTDFYPNSSLIFGGFYKSSSGVSTFSYKSGNNKFYTKLVFYCSEPVTTIADFNINLIAGEHLSTKKGNMHALNFSNGTTTVNSTEFTLMPANDYSNKVHPGYATAQVNLTAINTRASFSDSANLATTPVTLDVNSTNNYQTTINLNTLYKDFDLTSGGVLPGGSGSPSLTIKSVIVPQYEYMAITGDGALTPTDRVKYTLRANSSYYNVIDKDTMSNASAFTKASTTAQSNVPTGWDNSSDYYAAINKDAPNAFVSVQTAAGSITIKAQHATYSMYKSDRVTRNVITSGGYNGTTFTAANNTTNIKNLGHFYILVQISDNVNASDNGIYLPIAIQVNNTAPRSIGTAARSDLPTNKSAASASQAAPLALSGNVGDTFTVSAMGNASSNNYTTGYVLNDNDTMQAAPSDRVLAFDDDYYLNANGRLNEIAWIANLDNEAELDKLYASFIDSTVTDAASIAKNAAIAKKYFKFEKTYIYYQKSQFVTMAEDSALGRVKLANDSSGVNPDLNAVYFDTLGTSHHIINNVGNVITNQPVAFVKVPALSITLLRSTALEYVGGNSATSQYFIGNVSVCDSATSEANAPKARLLIKCEPSAVTAKESDKIFTRNYKDGTSYMTYENTGVPTLTYRLGAAKTFIVTPYDILTSVDLYVQPEQSPTSGIEGAVNATGITLNGMGGYVDATSKTYYPYGGTSANANNKNVFQVDGINNELHNAAMQDAFTKLAENFNAKRQTNDYYRTSATSVNITHGLWFKSFNVTTAADKLETPQIGNFVDFGAGKQSISFLQITSKARTSANAVVNAVVTNGRNNYDVRIIVSVINTAPENKDENREYDVYTDGTPEKANNVRIQASDAIFDVDNATIMFTSANLAIGIIDADGTFKTENAAGEPYSRYASVSISPNSDCLEVTAKSSTEQLTNRLYVRTTVSDTMANSIIYLPITIHNSAPYIAQQGLNGEYVDMTTGDPAKNEFDLGTQTSYHKGEYSTVLQTEENSATGMIFLTSDNVTANKITGKLGQMATTVPLIEDNDELQTFILTGYSANGYAYNKVPSTGIATWAASSENAVLISSNNLGISTDNLKDNIYIVYLLNVNGTEVAINEFDLTEAVNAANGVGGANYTGFTDELTGTVYDSGAITADDLKAAAFKGDIFNVDSFAIRVRTGAEAQLKVAICARDTEISSNTSVVSRAYVASKARAADTAEDKSAKVNLVIDYSQKTAGFKTASSYASTNRVFTITSGATKYVPYTDTVDNNTLKAVDYNTYKANPELYPTAYIYPESIVVPQDSSDYVYVPMSYIALTTGSFNLETNQVTNAAMFYAENMFTESKQDETFKNALSLTIDRPNASRIVVDGTRINDSADNTYFTVEYVNGVNNATYITDAAKAKLLASAYVNPYLTVTVDSNGNASKSQEVDKFDVNMFGIKLTRKQSRTANAQVTLNATVAKAANYLSSNVLSSGIVPKGFDTSSTDPEQVPLKITVANSPFELDTTSAGSSLNTTDSGSMYVNVRTHTTSAHTQHTIRLANQKETAQANTNTTVIRYSDLDTEVSGSTVQTVQGDTLQFYMDSLYTLDQSASHMQYISSTFEKNSAGNIYGVANSGHVKYAASLNNYFGIANGDDLNFSNYQPNGGVYGTNNQIGNNAFGLPLEYSTSGFTSSQREGFSSYFAVNAASGAISIEPLAKTLINEEAVLEIANLLAANNKDIYGVAFTGSYSSYSDLSQAQVSAIYKTRGLVAEFNVGTNQVAASYYPLKMLVYDYGGSGTSILDSSITSIEIRVYIENAQPVSDETATYTLSISTGNTASINLSSLITDPDLAVDVNGNLYTEQGFKANAKSIVRETGDYVKSPYAHNDLTATIENPNETTWKDINYDSTLRECVQNANGVIVSEHRASLATANNTSSVVMYMQTNEVINGEPKPCAATALTQTLNTVQFKVNSRPATSNGYINKVAFSLEVYDNHYNGNIGTPAKVTFIIQIDNERPTVNTSAAVTMKTGDVFTLMASDFTKWNGKSGVESPTAYTFSHTKTLLDSNTIGSPSNAKMGGFATTKDGVAVYEQWSLNGDGRNLNIDSPLDNNSSGTNVNLGYLALANDDLPWSLRIQDIQMSGDYFNQIEQNLLSVSSASSTRKPFSVTFKAKAACSNGSMNVTVVDENGSTVTFTLNFTIVSAAPEMREKNLTTSTGIYITSDNANAGEVELFMSGDGGTSTNSVKRNVNGVVKRVFKQATFKLSDIARDSDTGETEQMELFLGGYGDGYFSVNGAPLSQKNGISETDYLRLAWDNNARAITITLKKYDSARSSEVIKFYIKDAGSAMLNQALPVTVTVNVYSSDLVNNKYSSIQDLGEIPSLKEEATVVSTAAFAASNNKLTTRVSYLDTQAAAGVVGTVLKDNDSSAIGYNVSLYALLKLNGDTEELEPMTAKEFTTSYITGGDGALNLKDIQSGKFYANTSTLEGIRLTTRTASGAFSSGNRQANAYINNYVTIVQDDKGFLLSPVSSTLETPLLFYVAVEKDMARDTGMFDGAILKSGYILEVEVENSNPIANTSATVTSGVGYKGSELTFTVFSDTGRALFSDPDIGDNVTYSFDGKTDADYSRIIEGLSVDGDAPSKNRTDWQSNLAQGKGRAFDISTSGNTLTIKINRRIDVLVEGEDSYYADAVTVSFAITAKDTGGLTATTVLNITVLNSPMTVETGTVNGTDNTNYSVSYVSDTYYEVTASVRQDAQTPLRMQLTEFIKDADYSESGYTESFRISNVAPALTATGESIGVDTQYVKASHTSTNPFVYVLNSKDDEVTDSINAYTYTDSTVKSYVGYTTSGIVIDPKTYDKAYSGVAVFYFRVLDRGTKGYTKEGTEITAADGITFRVTVNILNSSPKAAQKSITQVYEGSETEANITTLEFDARDYITDPNPSDTEVLSITSHRMGLTSGMYTTRSDINVNDTALFYFSPNATDAAAFTLTPFYGVYGRQAVTITVSDGEYSVEFTVNVEIVYNSDDLPTLAKVSTYRARKVSVTGELLIGKLETSGSSTGGSHDVASDYELINVEYTQESAAYVEVVKDEEAAVPTWILTAKQVTKSGDLPMQATFKKLRIAQADESAQEVSTSASDITEFTKTFNINIKENSAPRILFDTYTFSHNDTVNVKLQLNSQNTVAIAPETLFTDSEGDGDLGDVMTIVDAKSAKPSLVNASVNERGFLVITFAAKGEARITVRVSDATGEAVSRSFTAINIDMPAPGMWLSIVTSFETNQTTWIICMCAVALVIIIIAVLIVVYVRRKHAREEVEALLISEMEFEDNMLRIAQDTSRQYAELAAPPKPMVSPDMMLNAGVQMPNFEQLAAPEAPQLELNAPNPTQPNPTDLPDNND